MLLTLFPLLIWLILAYFIGWLVGEIVSLEYLNRFNRLFKRTFIGCTVTIVSFALYNTGGHSTLLIIPIILMGIFLTFYSSRFAINFKIKAFSLADEGKDLLLIMLAGVIFWFIELNHFINPFTGEMKGLMFYTGSEWDLDYYVRLANYLQEFGIENRSVDFMNPELYGPEPYHFFEIWSGAVPIQFTGFNDVFSYYLIAMPFLLTTLFFIITDVIQIFLNSFSPSHLGLSPVLALTYFFISGFSFLYPDYGILKMDVYSEDSIAFLKPLMVNFGIFLVIKAIASGNEKWILWTMILAGSFYLPLLPVFLLMSFFVFMHFVFSKPINLTRNFIFIFATTGTICAIVLFVILGNDSFVELGLLQSESYSLVFSDFDFKTFVNIFGKGFLQIFFLLILYVFLFYVNNRTIFKRVDLGWMSYISMFLLIPLFIYALFNKLVDSVQFWCLIFIVITNILIFFTLLSGLIAKNKMVRGMNVILVLFYLYYNHPFEVRDESLVESETFDKLQEHIKTAESPLFAIVKGQEDYKEIFDLGMHIDYPAREINLVVKSYKAVCISWNKIPKQKDKIADLLLKQDLLMNPFYRYCILHLSEPIEKLQLEFIRANKIKFLIVSPNALMPEIFSEFVKDTITGFTDSSTIYVLK